MAHWSTPLAEPWCELTEYHPSLWPRPEAACRVDMTVRPDIDKLTAPMLCKGSCPIKGDPGIVATSLHQATVLGAFRLTVRPSGNESAPQTVCNKYGWAGRLPYSLVQFSHPGLFIRDVEIGLVNEANRRIDLRPDRLPVLRAATTHARHHQDSLFVQIAIMGARRCHVVSGVGPAGASA